MIDCGQEPVFASQYPARDPVLPKRLRPVHAQGLPAQGILDIYCHIRPPAPCNLLLAAPGVHIIEVLRHTQPECQVNQATAGEMQSGIKSGSLFRRVSRYGSVMNQGITVQSVALIVKGMSSSGNGYNDRHAK